MSIAHLLEDFSTPTADTPTHAETTGDADMLASFEQGYKAGWDDAIKASSEEQAHIAADLARNLQDLSFTYTEAYVAMAAAMKPVLEQIVTKVLPPIAQASLVPRIVEQLEDLCKGATDVTAEIVAAPGTAERLSAYLPGSISMPVEILEDSSLTDGQAFIRLGTREKQIAMDDVLSGIEEAIAGFFHETEKEARHG
ncbi:flagellar assembly protein FliH [Salinihabitans flavidus]|uniref:Flagellar assembly protein FliH n=1 Tax=Salinihabitans flavidus TaxID=569882 RepID=A0A1H8LRL3_9RHOB|nr:hypothetical protein [Salinihabitans flavidus]SEO07741.1 flagellar assembly protein FliH [Salinihabitans flavidus]